jgi:hypothetical protein
LVVKTGAADEAQRLIATPVKFATLHIFDIFNRAGPGGIPLKACSKAPSHGVAADFTDDKNKQKSIWRGTLPFTI